MKLYLCNYPFKTLHCRQNCLHGKEPHRMDECSRCEYCDIVDEEIKCRPLTKKEMKENGKNHI